MNRIVLVTILVVALTGGINAQEKTEVYAKVGKGVQIKTGDSLFYMKMTTRIQTRWDFVNYQSAPGMDATFENKAWVKRARLKFDGYFLNKSLVYKIEYDLAGGYVRDALLKYKKENFELWFGQGKLPGNRERVVSSGNLQFVDRSMFNANYTLDRDVGIQLHHKFKVGNAVFYDRWALTTGDGIRNFQYSPGVSVTGKFEVLPMGEFKSKGDYKSADLSREEKVKVAFAVYGNYNADANKDRGQIGTFFDANADLLNFGGDFVLKYRGYSLMLEGGKRLVTDDNELVLDASGTVVDAFYTGYGANVQTGYVFKNNWELSGRYAFTTPDNTAFHYEIRDYTFGISKYIIGHNFKFQGDVTYRDIATDQNMVITRLQMEFQF